MATVANGYPAELNASMNTLVARRDVTLDAADQHDEPMSDLGLQGTVARCPLRPVCALASTLL